MYESFIQQMHRICLSLNLPLFRLASNRTRHLENGAEMNWFVKYYLQLKFNL